MKVEGWWSEEARCFMVKDGQEVDLDRGEHVSLTVSRPRSRSQHNLLFAALAVAYKNWPEDHEFQPVDVDDLRFWLEVKAGHGVKVAFGDAADMLDFIRKHWRENMVIDYPNVWIAKSIKYGRMARGAFHELCEELDRVLAEEAGFCLADCKMSAIEDAK